MVETFFTEKRIIKKIIIAIVFIFMFNFTFNYLGNNVVFATEVPEGNAKPVEDDFYDGALEEGGGKLLLPIYHLLIFITDSVLELMQMSFYSNTPIKITAKSPDAAGISSGTVWTVIIGGVLAVGGAALAICAPGLGTAIGSWLAKKGIEVAIGGLVLKAIVAGTIISVGGVITASVGVVQGVEELQGKFDLPMIYYTPEMIFANEIPLFDINFFNPSEDKYETTTVINNEKMGETNSAIGDSGIEDIYTESVGRVLKLAGYEEKVSSGNQSIIEKMNKDLNYTLASKAPGYEINGRKYYVFMNLFTGGGEKYMHTEITVYYYDADSREVEVYKEHHETEEEARKAFENWSYSYSEFGSADAENTQLTDIKEDYKKILKQKMQILMEKGKNSEDIFEENFDYEGVPLKLTYQYTTSQGVLYLNDIPEEVVVNTYQSSSKILQTTVSSMYKTLRTVAIVALLSILVYVGIRMVLSSASKDKAKYKQMLMDWLVAFILLFVLHYLMAFIIDISENLTQICNKSNIANITIPIPNGTQIYNDETKSWERLDKNQENPDSTPDVHITNFVGYIRFMAGLVEKDGFTAKGIAFTLMYIVLVIYIAMFTFQYMKRVLYMAFLTMIAPLVAITYPLDKLSDGKAQGFNMWLKEYIFNSLLQPIHYIIYVIIMGSVMELVVGHPVYALVALGFMVPAEKFIRKMFGFEKASTVGTFGAAAGAAALMGGLQKLTHKPHRKGNDDNGAKGDKDNSSGKIRTISAMPDGPNNPDGGQGLTGGGSSNAGGTLLGGGTSNGGVTPETAGNSEIRMARMGYGPQEGDPNFIGPVRPQEGDSNFIGPVRPQEGDPNFIGPVRPQEGDPNFIGPIRPQEGDPNFIGPVRPPQTGNSRTTTSNNAQPRRRTVGGALKNGVRAVAGHYTRRLDNRIRRAHPLRALRRALTFGAGALTLGAIGLAAGIASGDASKALQYTTAGALAGGHLGKNIGETASNIVGLDGAAKSFKAGVLGDDYDKAERAKYKRNFKNNVSNYDEGVKTVGVDGWKDMSKNGGIIDTGIDYGINNVNDLGNIYKAKEQFKNQYSMSDEEAQDWAFKAYKLDQNFGDWSKNSKTRENLDKLLKAKGYTDDAQREEVTKQMVRTMGVYQDVALDKEIEETKPDYSRFANQPEERQEQERQEDREYQDEYRGSQPTEIPIQQSNVNEQEEIARRANAESEANKAAVRQKEENRKIQEELEARAKADKKAERRARAETARQRNAQAKAKREGMETKNGGLGETKASDAVNPNKRVIKPKTRDINPISSDPGNNGNGPINTI